MAASSSGTDRTRASSSGCRPDLKRALVREVARRGGNLNDVAGRLLAERFGVAVRAASGRRRKPARRRRAGVVAPAHAARALKPRSTPRRARTPHASTSTTSSSTRSQTASTSPSRPTDERNQWLDTNGKTKRQGARPHEDKVRVAIIGVGNCANSLLQGVEYYKDADPDDQFVPGLMHVDLGGYHVRDIEFTAAFDVTADKVGKDLADAIWAHPNDTIKFADVPKTGVTVSRGMTHDGIGKYLSEVVEKAPGETDDVVGILKETNTDVVVNYLPVGSEEATKWYAEQILEAGCAMVNCMPVFIAREAYWQKRFEEAGLPIIGDDIKSQVGATITHRVLTSLFRERGVHLDRTMQLNVGGNSDFLNMLERDRLESKKISKTNAVTSMLDYDLGAENVHVGPSDYVPWLTDRKWAYIRMEGTSFGDVPLNVELKLEVWDSPNSAGIVIDAVRLAKLALNNGVAGALEGPERVPDEVAAEADRRRRGVRAHRALHQAARKREEDEGIARKTRRPSVRIVLPSWRGPPSLMSRAVAPLGRSRRSGSRCRSGGHVVDVHRERRRHGSERVDHGMSLSTNMAARVPRQVESSPPLTTSGSPTRRRRRRAVGSSVLRSKR